MNRIIVASFIFIFSLSQIAFSKEATFAQNPDKIFNSALSIISSQKHEIKEINYSKGKAIFTTQTDSYFLEVMQAGKMTTIKIDEINASNEATKTTIDNIIQQLISQYGTKQ
ncbi:hypothetical protein IKA92_03215 [bacterium]|nr:hypothetical protein [bacterium]